MSSSHQLAQTHPQSDTLISTLISTAEDMLNTSEGWQLLTGGPVGTASIGPELMGHSPVSPVPCGSVA